MILLLLLWTLLAPLCAQTKNFTEPAWWDQGVVFVGNWEPLVFRIRHGGELPVDVAESYRREHTEDTVLRLKAAGVTMVLTHFYKTGLDSDKEDIELARQLGVLCHKHGMKLGTYIGGTIFAETLLRDVPEAKNWVRYDEYGNPIRYSEQTYRYRPDFNHPGYVEHMKRVIKIAIEDVKTDLIHLDNHALQAPPQTGDTPEINRRFREFLRRKYTPEQLKNRLGFSDISAVTVPTWHGISRPAAISPITDPLIEEWVDFRCQDFADYYGKLAGYIRQLNPNVVVELNPHGIYGSNRAFLNGIDHVRLLPHGSVFWSEEPNEAQVGADGILVSKIRSYKLARSLDETLFTYTGGQRGSYRLLMAEAMAFNRNCLGDIGGPLSEFPGDLLRYIRFYRENNRYYSATRTVADVALLRSFPSLAFNSLGPQLETTLMEQLLIQYKIPFEYVFDSGLGGLGKYRTLILADQESLSDRAVEQIRAFVRNGGGLVVTGRTSLYNEWRRLRSDYGLADVTGVHLNAEPESRHTGRVAYVRAVVPAVRAGSESVAASGFTRRYWKLPVNSDELVAAIRYAAGRPFPAEFGKAPLTTVMELTENNTGRILHWVNFKLGTPVAPAVVTLAVPAGRKVKSVTVISPDRKAGAPLAFSMERGRVRFTMPALEVYNVAIVALE